MAFTITARHSGTSGATAVQTQATNSTTPTANSLLLAFACVERDLHTVVESWTISGGGTWTAVAASASFAWNGTPDFNVTSALQSLAVGASPSAHTITADAWTGVEDGYYSVIAADITGHGALLQSKTGGATEGGGDSESLAVTFDSVLTNGSLVIACFAAGNDLAGAFTAPTIGGQAMIELHNLTGNFCHAGMWYRVLTGAESDQTVTCSDLGQSVGASAAILLEYAAAGGGTSHTQTPTDNEGLTDSADIGQTKGLPGDLLGLSDLSTSFNFGSAVTNALGLSDSALVEKVLAQASTDNLGLTDSVTAALGRAATDSLGLTDSVALAAGHVLADSLGLTDSAQVSLAGAGSVAASDNLGITDTRAFDQGHAYSDSLGVTDTAALAKGQATADSLGLTDTSSLVFDRAQVPADTEALTDSAQVSLTGAGAVTAADNLGITDGLVVDQGHGYSDTAGLTDAAVSLLDAVRSIIDNAALTDSVQVLLAVPPTSGTAHAASGQAPSASAAAMTVSTATGG
jgi:hypothetical protein